MMLLRVYLLIACVAAANVEAAHSKQLRANQSIQRIESKRAATSGECSTGKKLVNLVEYVMSLVRSDSSAGSMVSSESVNKMASQMKLFCFAWASLHKKEHEVLKAFRSQMSNCNGHAIFTDRIPDGVEHSSDIQLVSIPTQAANRSADNFLYHRNMVGLMPAWTYLLNTGTAEKYDWVINVELDHFVRPTKVKSTIAQYLDILRDSCENVDGPMLLAFGNAFLFNREVVQQMKSQWNRVGRVAPQNSEARGCPMIQEGKAEWPTHCSQDMVYQNLAKALQPSAPMFGATGCGQTMRARNGALLPMACLEMTHLALGKISVEKQQMLVGEFQKVRSMKSKEEVKLHYKNSPLEPVAELLYASKDVPVIHHIANSEIHKRARHVLR
eukprot:TRINITY_DN17265_c1_g2_i1.p1 TRINITY_DN17265_c1_g2~~TRINITY_DN17265_c1_g2_i1.p1  ORF type:complete len:385 (-),score=55.22 TRINITY_DN17265_c1_g2_i1:77-1231(-)